MVTAIVDRPVPPSSPDDALLLGRRRVGSAERRVGAVCAVWMTGGLFLDGWAHSVEKPETFLTPWHGVLYSGFAAIAVWMWRLIVRSAQPGRPLSSTIPVGYGLGAVGVVCFGVGGVADFAWHSLLGIERSINALFSPPHLLLFGGGMMLLTTALRHAWADAALSGDVVLSWGDLGAPILSMAIATSIVGFFLMELSPFRFPLMGFRRLAYWKSLGEGDTYSVLGFGGLAVTTMLLVLPVLLLLRRWRLPFGSITLMWTLPAFLLSGSLGFRTLGLVPAALVGGVAADIALARSWFGMRTSGSARFACAAGTGAMWLAYVGLTEWRFGMGWSAELWAGSIMLCAGGAFLLACLAFPPALPFETSAPR